MVFDSAPLPRPYRRHRPGPKAYFNSTRTIVPPGSRMVTARAEDLSSTINNFRCNAQSHNCSLGSPSTSSPQVPSQKPEHNNPGLPGQDCLLQEPCVCYGPCASLHHSPQLMCELAHTKYLLSTSANPRHLRSSKTCPPRVEIY